MRLQFSCPRPHVRSCLVLVLLCLSLPRIAAAQAQYHVLEKGETLYSIARVYGVEPKALAKANSIDDPSKLRVGMKLLIPGDQSAPATVSTHRVAKGETLFSIAMATRTSVDSLRSANKLLPSSIIKVGDLLILPASADRAGVRSSTPPPAAVPAADPAPAPAPLPDAVKTSAKIADKGLIWPCSGEIRYLDGKAYGVLIRAKLGEGMRAVSSGTVSSAGPYRGYGSVVFVLSHGYIYVYGGNDSISVRPGDQVTAGQELGKVGVDSRQGGSAAYFLVFKSGVAVDPASAPRD